VEPGRSLAATNIELQDFPLCASINFCLKDTLNVLFKSCRNVVYNEK